VGAERRGEKRDLTVLQGGEQLIAQPIRRGEVSTQIMKQVWEKFQV